MTDRLAKLGRVVYTIVQDEVSNITKNVKKAIRSLVLVVSVILLIVGATTSAYSTMTGVVAFLFLLAFSIALRIVWGVPGLLGLVYYYTTYYLTLEEIKLKEENEARYMPKIQDFTFKIVSTNQEADELAAHGLEFRSRPLKYRERLDKGAIASCIFVGRELAHTSWLAFTEEAKQTFGALPQKVDFANNEAYYGDSLTNPKYRGLGLATYEHFKLYQFLKERGRSVCRGIIWKDNLLSQKKLNPKIYAGGRYLNLLREKGKLVAQAAVARDYLASLAGFDAQIYAEARFLKILWWRFWKETPIYQTE